MSAAARPVRAVLFDLDGTLVDTAADLAGCVQDVMRRRGRRAPAFEALRAYVSQGFRGLLAAGFGTAFVESADYPAVLDECLDLYSTRLAEHSRPFPGMRRVLDELARQRIGWGVVTNKPERLARSLLDALGLAEQCGVTVGGGATAHNKPHPEPVRHAARHLALEAADCVMLGDDLRDIQAATAAGAVGLAAAWGYFLPGENLHAWGAAAVLESPGDLLAWIASHGIAAPPGARTSRAA